MKRRGFLLGLFGSTSAVSLLAQAKADPFSARTLDAAFDRAVALDAHLEDQRRSKEFADKFLGLCEINGSPGRWL